MRKTLCSLLIFTALTGILASYTFSKVGVGIGTGKIVVDEKLKPGVIYNLPPITVFNTGTEVSRYGASLEYRQAQPELLPEREWFTFDPQEFTLEPGQAQAVAIKVNIPLKVVPGEYFAYLEGHPIVVAESGLTAVNVAAAAKLYFTIAPANVFQGIYYRIISLWKEFEPWSTRVSVFLGLVVVIAALKKNLNIEVSTKGKKEKKTKPISSLLDD